MLRKHFGEKSLRPGAARAIALTLIVIMLSAGCAGKPPVDDSDAGEPAERDASVPTAPPVAAPPPADPRTVTIAAVGDMMLGTDYPQNHLPDDDGDSFLAGVAPLLRAPDITFGNLEGVLLDGGEPAKKCRNESACYLFRSPPRYVRHFVDAGFDVLSLANNHARDFGEDGRSATMRTIAAAGLHHSGREGDFASFSFDGLRIAVLAFAVTRNSNMLLDYGCSAATVRAHAAQHDIVIVSFHGGAEGRDVMHLPFGEEEYYEEPRGDVVRFARLMVDAGADLVLGHGPHVVRAMEHYRGRLIAYSLGNFATYYGISVEGVKGIAPILVARLDAAGRFLDARIHSTLQLRPDGPRLDDRRQALNLIRDLSRTDFGDPGLAFLDDGLVVPEVRQHLRPWPETAGDEAAADEQQGCRAAAP
jgi:poly-gamma-glutamate capsule biosynthesis protein CapA/YwtB (metallophosphatase superfamily)